MTDQGRKRDAKVRAARTLLQGAMAAGLLAGVGAVAEALKADQADWTTLGVSAGTACVMAGLSYIQRAYLDRRRKAVTD